jgi:hypothetical protein
VEENGRFRVIAFDYDDAPAWGGEMHARIHFPFFQRRPANARSWLTFCAAVVLLRAVSNWRKQRTDPGGARRIAVASFILSGVAWAGKVHAPTPGAAVGLMIAAAADWLFTAAVLWMAYLALEPEVRE